MNRTHHSWYSHRLGRELPLLVYGHAGAKVLVFPTRDGGCDEYERLGIVEQLAPKLAAGQLQLYCVDSVDHEALYCLWKHPEQRLRYHLLYEEYILNEVLPLMAMLNPYPCTIAHGLSFGAYHAANMAFRHPQLFQKLCALSGRYDVTLAVDCFRDLLDGWRSADLYFHSPLLYLPGLHGWQLDALRRMDIVLAVGREDPFLDNNLTLREVLYNKGVLHALHEWDGRAHCGHAWRKMVPLYL